MTPEELEARRLAEEAEAQRLAQEAEATNPMMQPTDLIGQRGQQETGTDTNPLLTAGLGLGGGAVASQTGGAPATSQVLSSFAQKVAAQDAATRAAQRAAFNPAIIGQNLPAKGVNPAVTGTPKLPFQTPSSVFGSNLPAGGVNPEVKGRVKPNVFSSPKAKSPTPKQITPNNILGGSNAGLLSRLAGSLLTAATMPTPTGDSSLRGAYNRLVEAGENPAAAAARLGIADTSIRELDSSNREVATVDGRGVLNGVNLFTGDAASTGSNYADVVNADRAQAASAKALMEEDTFVEPFDFAGEIQRNPTPYSGLVDNNPFTALGGTPVEENPYTVARAGLTPEERARIETRLARTNAGILADGMVQEAREGSTVGGFVENAAKKGFDYLFGNPTAEQAQNILETQPTDPAQRARLQAIAAGEGGPSDLSRAVTYLFGRPENAGDPNIMEAQAPAPTLDTALAEQGTTPALAEQGSPQAIFERIRAKGPLSPELIAAGQKRAAILGTTFDPETGFSRDPFLQFQQAQQAQQAEREALANRPGYGYGGAVNDQYQSADFDTISQGVFDTPMTGMRPINAETGEPLSQGVIDAAARAGLELPMGSVPLPQAPVNSVPMGRDATRAALGGRTLNQYLNAPDGTPGVYGLRTDPQGRMIPAGAPGTSQTRADAYPSYEGFAAEREGRLAARMQQPGESITERDTRIAAERTQSSQNVPTDVREAMLTPEGRRTAKQINRLARWGGSTQGQEMGGVAGLEESQKSTQQKQEDELQNRYMQARLTEFEKVDPSAYETAQSTVDDFIANGGGDPSKRSQYIAKILGLAPSGQTGYEDFMKPKDLPIVLTDADYAKLKPGNQYIDSKGNTATKPE